VLPNDIRRGVDAIWDKIWSSGVSNPLTAIEYLSAVLLLRRAASLPKGSQTSDNCSWDRLREVVADRDSEAIAQLMLSVQQQYGVGASPEIASASTWRDVSTLAQVMWQVEQLKIEDRNHDILGDVFEYVLNHLSTAGHFGQFRTPRHLIRFMVEALDPRADERVVDPACGTAGFLIAAREYRGISQGTYGGVEVDSSIARIAQTNALTHGLGRDAIQHADSFEIRDRDADVILANPPFAGSVTLERVADFKAGTQKSELLFLELMTNRLRPGGRAGVVVPTGVLTSTAAAATWVRRQLLESNHLEAIIELPSGVFRPYTDVKTAVIFWRNAPSGSDVLMVRVDADGHSLDDRRETIDTNDLPEALALLRGASNALVANTRVTNATIAKNRYILSPTRYIDTQLPCRGYDGPTLVEAVQNVRLELDGLECDINELEGVLR